MISLPDKIPPAPFEELSRKLAAHQKWVRSRVRGLELEPPPDLSGIDLSGINLCCINLPGANLVGANLVGVNLVGADLTGANLTGAMLMGAKLEGVQLPDFQLCPPKGTEFTAWKKVRGGFVLELEIPADAERTSSLVGRKCRASRALVISAFLPGGEVSARDEFDSLHDWEFTYRVGGVAEEPRYDGDIRVECTQGIHFFMTHLEAKNYYG